MKEKMAQIGKKTGLEVKEVNNLTKIGISGLLALGLSVFTGFATAYAAEPVRPGPILPANKCDVTPKKCKSNESVIRYYFNREFQTCEAVSSCDTSGFDSMEACEKACNYPVSKYGGISRSDFENAK